ncbi:MAG: glycosyltransferase family 39 protein [Anaerolineae bacterium]|nr:glycosyltransferase family 39 protein [Anaerolineae bacterium]
MLLSSPSTPSQRLPDEPAGRRLLAGLLSSTGIAVLIVVMGAAARLVNLGSRSLWLDEILTILRARGPAISDVIAVIRATPDQMPLYELSLWLLRGFGESEFIVRLPSALAGSALVWVMYWLGKELFNPLVGLFAALLIAILPFGIWYSQEARPYAFLMLFASCQALAAYRAVTNHYFLNWLSLVLFSILSLYTHHLGLLMTASVFTFVGLAILFNVGRGWLGGARSSALSDDRLRIGSQIGFALMAAGLVGLGYWPGFTLLQGFLARPELGFGGPNAAYTLTWSDVQTQLAQFDLAGLMLALFIVGGLAGIHWLGRGRRLAVLLLAVWLIVPLAAFWWRKESSIVFLAQRHLSFLFPGAVVMLALGTHGLVSGLGWLARQLSRYVTNSWPSNILVQRGATVMMGLLLLGWIYPRLMASYERPKEDYRGAAQRIIATSPPNSTVIAIGKGQSFVVTSLGFYLKHLNSPIPVTPGVLIDNQAIERLQQPGGDVWGVVFTPIDEEKERIIPPDFKVTPMTGLLLVRPPRTGGAAEQAEALLRWGSTFQSVLETSANFVAFKGGKTKLGPNLLPDLRAPAAPAGAPTEYWNLTPGARLSDDKLSFVLTPTGEMVNATFVIRKVQPGENYALFFSCRNGDLKGDQRVYITATSADGKLIDIIPSGAGYLCPPSATLTPQAFSFKVPAGVAALGLWLRATGMGTAEYATIELRRLE